MIKVYAVTLVVGVIGLLIAIFGGTLAENLNRPEMDPGNRLGLRGKATVGALVGFGMGGLSAEFSPFDLSWPVALALAIVAAGLSAYWVRFALTSQASP